MERKTPCEIWQVLAENLWTLPRMQDAVQTCADAVRRSKKVFVAGCGRSGLVSRCFAMRLRHLGIESYVVGEAATPPAGNGDLFIGVSCSGGHSSLCALAATARRLGCRVLAVTAQGKSPLARTAHTVLVVPLPRSVQFGNSLFEQAVLLFFDAAALLLQRRKRLPSSQMWRRHANIE